MKRRLALIALTLFAVVAAAAPADAEQARIDRLIGAVAARSDCRFVRNGREYAAADAATFLRRKMQSMGSKVVTAQDFIEQIASKSSTSGEPYMIRYGDGREVTSEQFLRAELARIGSGD